MEPLSTVAIVGIALNAITSVVDTIRDQTANHEQRMINKWDYLKDMYELELNKPQYDPFKTDEENTNARDNDLLLNMRDQLLRYGEALTKQLAASKGKS